MAALFYMSYLHLLFFIPLLKLLRQQEPAKAEGVENQAEKYARPGHLLIFQHIGGIVGGNHRNQVIIQEMDNNRHPDVVGLHVGVGQENSQEDACHLLGHRHDQSPYPA